VLHITLRDHQPSMLVRLLQNGVRFEATDPPIEKALEIALEKNDAELARLILQAGADPNAKEDCVAFRYLSEDEEIGRTTRYEGPTMFYGTLFQWACAQGFEGVVRAFLDHNVDFDKPVYAAYSCGKMNVVRAILECYDDVDLVRLAADTVRKGDVFFLRELVEFDEVKRKLYGFSSAAFCRSRVSCPSASLSRRTKANGSGTREGYRVVD
jgi:ankyrin repeat protein